MRLSLSARLVESASPRPPVGEFLSLAKAAGFDAVGLREWQVPPDLTPAQVGVLKAVLADGGLRVFSINTRLAELPRLVSVARLLGVKVFQVDGTPEQLAEAAKALDPDMRLGPQMHTGGIYETVAAAAAALAPVTDRRVGVIVEPANLMFTGMEWSAAALLPLKGRIIGCNLQSVETGVGEQSLALRDGTTVTYRRVLLGDNAQIDLRGFIGALRQAGYHGAINAIEPAREGLTLLEIAKATRKALSRALR